MAKGAALEVEPGDVLISPFSPSRWKGREHLASFLMCYRSPPVIFDDGVRWHRGRQISRFCGCFAGEIDSTGTHYTRLQHKDRDLPTYLGPQNWAPFIQHHRRFRQLLSPRLSGEGRLGPAEMLGATVQGLLAIRWALSRPLNRPVHRCILDIKHYEITS